jgi:hypothetical protein
MAQLNDKTKMLVSAAGIFISYTIYGFLQERVTRGRYGDKVNEDGTTGERFTFTLALVAVQCLFNYLFAKGNKFSASFTTSSLTLLRFQRFLSPGHNRGMQRTRVTTPAVH